MAIYVIADLHLSFSQDKPMSIFGESWEGHSDKIKNNWISKVKQEDVDISGYCSVNPYITKEEDKKFEESNN